MDHVLGTAAEDAPYLDPAERERLGRFLASAAPWAALGCNVMPCAPGKKCPALAGWGDAPSTGGVWLARDWGLREGSLHSPESAKIPASVLQQWSLRHREANAWLFPGSMGCMVVDVDDLSLLEQTLEACGPTEYRTQSGRVGGGVHLWYTGTTTSRNAVVPGIDVKSSRGGVVSPGSLHPRTGHEYRGSDTMRDALEGRTTWAPPQIHSDWRARLQNLAKGLTHPTRIDLIALGDAIRSNAKKREIGKRIAMIGGGKVFAVDGEKEGVLYAVLAEIAHWWPAANTESMVGLFAPSAVLMDPSCDIPIAEQIRVKWERLTYHRAEQLDAQAQRLEDQRRDAWALCGVESAEMSDPLTAKIVAHKGRAYYMRVGEHWAGPMCRDDFSPDVLAALRAVYSIDAPDMGALLAGHGVLLREIAMSYTLSRTELQPLARLVVAIAPSRALEPVYSDVVAHGIDVLGGEHAEKLRHWIAGITRQDLPCRALVFSGSKGVGKSLFLAGLARLWPGGAARMRDVVGKRFNGALCESPFAVGDDDAGDSEQGQHLAGYLRAAVSDREQKVERKGQEIATVEGCMRFAVATNDAMELVRGALRVGLNDESFAAFADRLLHIPIGPDARGWWGEHDTDLLVAGDEIAQHALWLAEQPQHQEAQERFWVSAADESLHVLAQLSAGMRGDILLRIAQGSCGGLETSPDGNHIVTPSLFVPAWDIGRPKGLSLRTGGLAIQALSAAVPVPQPVSGSRRCYAISAELVAWYAERCGV